MAILFLEGGDTPSKNEPKKQATLPLPAVTAAAAVPSFGAQEAYLPSGVQPYTAQNGFTHLPLPLPLPARQAPQPAAYQPLRYNWADIGSMARNANLLQGDIFGTAPLKNAATKFFESTINTNKVSINGEGPVYMSSLQGMNNRQFDIYYNLLQETMNAEKERLASITAADFQNTDKLPHASNASVADEMSYTVPWKTYGELDTRTAVNIQNAANTAESFNRLLFKNETTEEKVQGNEEKNNEIIESMMTKYGFSQEEMDAILYENNRNIDLLFLSGDVITNFLPPEYTPVVCTYKITSFAKGLSDLEVEMVKNGAAEEEIDLARTYYIGETIYDVVTDLAIPSQWILPVLKSVFSVVSYLSKQDLSLLEKYVKALFEGSSNTEKPAGEEERQAIIENLVKDRQEINSQMFTNSFLDGM